MKTNILVQYEGGGYDGCYWEWNLFYIDNDGKFYDIFSSGRAGIDNIEKAKMLFTEELSTTYIYDLTSEKDLKDFAKETHAELIKCAVQWFSENTELELYGLCSECEEKIYDPDNMIIEGYKNPDLLCTDCYFLGRCIGCSEYVGQDNLEYNEDDDSDLCEDCLKELEDKITIVD